MNEPVKSFNKICSRLCIKLTGHLSSPLSVGSGEQKYSDADVVFHANGRPYIPGSSLAGALRDYSNAVKGEEETKKLFGTPKDGEPGRGDDRQSRIFIYDAVLEDEKMGVREGVKLNERKTANKMGKYDRQFIEQGASVNIRIEIIDRADCFKDAKDVHQLWERNLEWVKLWQRGFSEGELRLGARSRRGFGRIEIEHIFVKKFDMRDNTSYMKWLDWDWEHIDSFTEQESVEIPIQGELWTDTDRLERCLEVPLHIAGTLLVRTYAAAFSKKADIPDYGQMTIGGKGERAVIPGSAWAGAFRSHIAKIVREMGQLPEWEQAQKILNPLFGTWIAGDDNKQELCASRVIFEETAVEGGHGLLTARIAIDRFTGGTVQGALYEERPWIGGNVTLRIRWKKGEEELTDEAVCGMLLWAVKDLQEGILTVGGESSVGRGICEPVKKNPDILLDGKAIEEEKQREYMKMAALWVQEALKDKSKGSETDGEI